MTSTRTKWLRIRMPATCPVCQHKRASGCSIASDGSAVVCIRVESAKPMPGNGMGWLHKLSEPLPPPPPPKKKVQEAPVTDWTAAVRDWCANVKAHDLANLADGLGVTVASLQQLRIGWNGVAWTFPMQDATGRIVGVQRRFLGGRKVTAEGSKGGIFAPVNPIGDMLTQIFVCEGPTDTAYLLGLGVAAVGRFSNSSCVELLKTLLRVRGLNVVIVADADQPDKNGIRPGQAGAETLADELVWIGRRWVKIIYPIRGKDIREWKPSLVTLDRCVDAAPIWLKREKHHG